MHSSAAWESEASPLPWPPAACCSCECLPPSKINHAHGTECPSALPPATSAQTPRFHQGARIISSPWPKTGHHLHHPRSGLAGPKAASPRGLLQQCKFSPVGLCTCVCVFVYVCVFTPRGDRGLCQLREPKIFFSFLETSSSGDKRWRKTTPSTRDVCLRYLSLVPYEAQPVDPLDECSEMILTAEFKKAINRDLGVNVITVLTTQNVQ